MKQLTGSKLGREYVKAIYFHPAYWHSMQSTSCKMAGWVTNKLELKLPQKTSAITDDTNLMAETEEELKNLLTRVTLSSVKKLA